MKLSHIRKCVDAVDLCMRSPLKRNEHEEMAIDMLRNTLVDIEEYLIRLRENAKRMEDYFSLVQKRMITVQNRQQELMNLAINGQAEATTQIAQLTHALSELQPEDIDVQGEHSGS